MYAYCVYIFDLIEEWLKLWELTISPVWYWNRNIAEISEYQAADAVLRQWTKSSVDCNVPLFRNKRFKPPAPTQCRWLSANANISLQWRYNDRDGVSNHRHLDCLLHSFRRRSKKISKFRVTGLCVGNSPVIGEFPAQMASNAGNASIWWRHHVLMIMHTRRLKVTRHSQHPTKVHGISTTHPEYHVYNFRSAVLWFRLSLPITSDHFTDTEGSEATQKNVSK